MSDADTNYADTSKGCGDFQATYDTEFNTFTYKQHLVYGVDR